MAKQNRAHGILKNATSNYARQIIQILIFLLLTPYIVGKVGRDDFGLWSLIQATIGLLGLMDMGFATSVVKYVAEARGARDAPRIRALTATFFWQYSFLGLMTLLVTLALVPVLPGVLGIPDDKAKTGQIVFALIGIRAALALPLGLFAGILVGYQQQILSNVTRVLGTASYGLGAWWALAVSPSLETLAIVSLATGVAANLLSMTFCLVRAPEVSFRPSLFSWKIMKDISAFSVWFFLIQISLLIATRVDTIIVNAVLPLAAVAVYTIAIRVAEKAQSLCKQFTTTLTPVISELKGADEKSNIRAVFIKGAMLSVALSTPMLVGLAFMAEDVIVAWMGEDFREAALPCQLLLAAAFVTIVHGNTENVLSLTGHQKYLALATIGGQVLNLGLTVALVLWMGLVGVALATLLAQLFVQLFFIQRRAGGLYSLSPVEFYGRVLWPSVPGAVACVAVLWGAGRVIGTESLMQVAAVLALGGIASVPAFWFVGLPRKERDYLAGRFRALVKGKRKAPAGEQEAAE